MRVGSRYLTAIEDTRVCLASRAKLLDGNFSTESSVFVYDSACDQFSNALKCDSKFNSLIFAGSEHIVGGGENGHIELFQIEQQVRQNRLESENQATPDSKDCDEAFGKENDESFEEEFKVKSSYVDALSLCHESSPLQIKSVHKRNNILTQDVLGLDYSPHKKMVVAGSCKSNLILFALADPKKVFYTGIQNDFGNITSTKFNQKFHHILSLTNAENAIIILDLRKKKEVVRIQNQSPISHVTWSSDKATKMYYIQDEKLLEFDLSTNEKRVLKEGIIDFHMLRTNGSDDFYIFRKNQVELCDGNMHSLGFLDVDRLHGANVSANAYSMSFVDHTEMGKTKRLNTRLGVNRTRKIPFAIVENQACTADQQYKISTRKDLLAENLDYAQFIVKKDANIEYILYSLRNPKERTPNLDNSEILAADDQPHSQKDVESMESTSEIQENGDNLKKESVELNCSAVSDSQIYITMLLAGVLSDYEKKEILLHLYRTSPSDSSFIMDNKDPALMAIICNSDADKNLNPDADDGNVEIPLNVLMCLSKNKKPSVDFSKVKDVRVALVLSEIFSEYSYVVNSASLKDWYLVCLWLLNIEKDKSEVKIALDLLGERLYRADMLNEAKICYILNNNLVEFTKIDNNHYLSRVKNQKLGNLVDFILGYGTVLKALQMNHLVEINLLSLEFIRIHRFFEMNSQIVQNLIAFAQKTDSINLLSDFMLFADYQAPRKETKSNDLSTLAMNQPRNIGNNTDSSFPTTKSSILSQTARNSTFSSEGIQRPSFPSTLASSYTHPTSNATQSRNFSAEPPLTSSAQMNAKNTQTPTYDSLAKTSSQNSAISNSVLASNTGANTQASYASVAPSKKSESILMPSIGSVSISQSAKSPTIGRQSQSSSASIPLTPPKIATSLHSNPSTPSSGPQLSIKPNTTTPRPFIRSSVAPSSVSRPSVPVPNSSVSSDLSATIPRQSTFDSNAQLQSKATSTPTPMQSSSFNNPRNSSITASSQQIQKPSSNANDSQAIDKNTFIKSKISKLIAAANLKTGMLYKTKINTSLKKLAILNDIMASNDNAHVAFKNELLPLLNVCDLLVIEDQKLTVESSQKPELLASFKSNCENISNKFNSDHVQAVTTGLIGLMQVALSER